MLSKRVFSRRCSFLLNGALFKVFTKSEHDQTPKIHESRFLLTKKFAHLLKPVCWKLVVYCCILLSCSISFCRQYGQSPLVSTVRGSFLLRTKLEPSIWSAAWYTYAVSLSLYFVVFSCSQQQQLVPWRRRPLAEEASQAYQAGRRRWLTAKEASRCSGE